MVTLCCKITIIHIFLISLSAKSSLDQFSNLSAFRDQLAAFQFAVGTGMIGLWDTSFSKVEDLICQTSPVSWDHISLLSFRADRGRSLVKK